MRMSATVCGGIGAAMIFAGAGASAARAAILSDWNLFVRTNMASTSEVDGSAFVGGTLSGNSSNFAVQGVTAPGNTGLVVGGVISGNPKQVNSGGNLRYGATGQNLVNVGGAGTRIADPTIPAQTTALYNEAVALSSHLSGLATNSSVVVNSGNGAFNSTPTLLGGFQVAVFSIASASIDNLASISLNLGGATSIVINVTDVGNATIQPPPNFLDQFNQANSSRIIWNFPNVTKLSLGGNFNGAVLAPNAELHITNGGINGSVVVDSIPQQQAEIRRFNYAGYIPTPGGAAVGVLSIALASRRRR